MRPSNLGPNLINGFRRDPGNNTVVRKTSKYFTQGFQKGNTLTASVRCGSPWVFWGQHGLAYSLQQSEGGYQSRISIKKIPKCVWGVVVSPIHQGCYCQGEFSGIENIYNLCFFVYLRMASFFVMAHGTRCGRVVVILTCKKDRTPPVRLFLTARYGYQCYHH